MSEEEVTYDGESPKAQQRNVALYPRDVRDAERIKAHYGLDSFSQAVRRAIRETTALVEREQREKAA